MSTKPVRVALISDSELILNGLRKILEYEPGIVIVAEGKGSRYLRECVLTERPDFIFLDNRERAYDAEKLMRSRLIKEHGIKVIQFTEGEPAGEGAPNLINVDQETTSTALVAVIMKGAGEKRVSPDPEEDSPGRIRITKTESRIIKLIAAGETNKSIAEKLSVSEKTVKAHITNIFEKLHLQNRYQLMLYGKRMKKNAEMGL